MHIAAAVSVKKAVAVSHGACCGRFMPYPKIDGLDYRFIFPPEISRNRYNPEYLKLKYCDGRDEDVALIDLKHVIDALNELLSLPV